MKQAKKIFFFLTVGSILVLTPFFYLLPASAAIGDEAIAPKVTIKNPASGTQGTASSLTVNYTVDRSASVDYLVDGTKKNGSAHGAGDYQFNFTNLSVGEHTLKIKACDPTSSNNGLCTEASIIYTVLTTEPSAPANSVSLSTPTATVGDDYVVTFNAVVTNNTAADLASTKTVLFKVPLSADDFEFCSATLGSTVAKNGGTKTVSCNYNFSTTKFNTLKGYDTATKDNEDNLTVSDNQLSVKFVAYYDNSITSGKGEFAISMSSTQSPALGNNKVTLQNGNYSLDTDKDGLSDYQESLFGTDSSKQDTDNDGFNDYKEISGGYSPTANQTQKDSNNFSRAIYGKLLPISESAKNSASSVLRAELKKLNKNFSLNMAPAYWTIYLNSFIYGGYTPDEIYNAFKKGFNSVHPSIEGSLWRKR